MKMIQQNLVNIPKKSRKAQQTNRAINGIIKHFQAKSNKFK